MTLGQRAKILLADDDFALRGSLAMALRERGFEPIEAACGREAVDLGRDLRPGLSLLDMNMPDMTGVDVLRRWLGAGLRIPVIFMTAETNATLRVEAVSLGALRVLDKPFGARELFAMVREALGWPGEDVN